MGIQIAVLASGGGSNLQALLDAWCSRQFGEAEIVLVVSDKPGAKALERGRVAGVTSIGLDPAGFPSREAYDRELAGQLSRRGIGLVCLAGYLRILTPEFTRLFALRILNIHPALLPAFGGPGMFGCHVHDAVVTSGAKYSGCTVHFVDEGTDTGPIVLQSIVPVMEHDTPESLAERVLVEEHRIYPRAVALFCENRLQVQGKRVRILEKA